jgi:hypothetical protein
MIKIPTVFILGAGASVPYDYPTGQGLRERIIKHAFGEKLIYESLGRNQELPFPIFNCKTYSELMQMGSIFSNIFSNAPISIDKFLNNNPKYAEMGKLSILCNILEAENLSQFNEKIKTDEHKKQDWYRHLFDRMTDSIINKKNGYEEFGNNQVKFITFNYDRSLENYLYTSLSNCYAEEIEDVAKLKRLTDEVRKIPIYHVYGSVGDLFWQSDKGYPYKDYSKFKQLWTLKDDLKIIYEQRNSDEIKTMKKIISDAKRICCLGFGYAEENMNILDLYNIISPEHQFAGTAYGLYENEINNIIYNFKTGNKFQDIPFAEMEAHMILKDTNSYELLRRNLV